MRDRAHYESSAFLQILRYNRQFLINPRWQQQRGGRCAALKITQDFGDGSALQVEALYSLPTAGGSSALSTLRLLK
jgi:hypothetical protein